ncbi:MAG: 6-bladed beta-propeller [Gemmatimonadales bacterium]
MAASACSQERVGGWAGTIDTLESGTVLISNPAQGIWREGSGWRLEDELKIGSREGGHGAFGDVWDFDVDRLGRIYVLDRIAQEVRVFDKDGSWIRNIGGPGGGPGEFIGVTGIAFDRQGRLWVLNQGNIRYSVFDTTGALVKEPPRRTGGARFAEWYGVFDRWGALYDVISYPSATGLKFAFALYDTTTGLFVDTIPGVGFVGGAPLFWGAHLGTPYGWWLGRATEYKIHETTFTGDTLRIVERPYDPIELARSKTDSSAQLEKRLRKQARGYLPPPAPDYMPVYFDFMEDEDRYLFVVLTSPSGATDTHVDVFDPAGRYLGGMIALYHVERRPPPVVRHNRMYFVTKDEMDVPYVVVLRILGRE